MTELVKYDTACRAVAECKTVDEAKNIRDKSVAMAAYARQARNKELEADAVEIRMRATRRLDELRQQQAETVGLAKGGEQYHSTGVSDTPVLPTLSESGIDKNLAKQMRALGRLSDDEFEEAIDRTRKAVQRAVKIEADRTERIENILNIAKGDAAPALRQRDRVISRLDKLHPRIGPHEKNVRTFRRGEVIRQEVEARIALSSASRVRILAAGSISSSGIGRARPSGVCRGVSVAMESRGDRQA